MLNIDNGKDENGNIVREPTKKWIEDPAIPDSVVITDFGISTSIRVKDSPKKAGTPGWAPPEQFLGEKSNKEDHFALGRLLVYMFSSWQTAWPLLFYPKEQILKLYNRLFNEIERTTGIKIDREAEIIDMILQIHQAAVGGQFDQTTMDLNRTIYEELRTIISGGVSRMVLVNRLLMTAIILKLSFLTIRIS